MLRHQLWAAKGWPRLRLREQRCLQLARVELLLSLVSKTTVPWPLQEAGTVSLPCTVSFLTSPCSSGGDPLKLDKRTDGHTPPMHRHKNAHTAYTRLLTPRRPRLRTARIKTCLQRLSLLPCPWASRALQLRLGTPCPDPDRAMFPNFFGSPAGQEDSQNWKRGAGVARPRCPHSEVS